MRKHILILTIIALAFSLIASPSSATQLWFEPAYQLYNLGDTLIIDLYADIDEEDAIFGFGFDLSFDGGATYISGPADTGSYLTFTDFTPNSILFESFPAFWDDGDTISGEVPWSDPDISGTNILLGAFYFDAPNFGAIGMENIYLGAPDPNDLWTPDGLFRGDISSPIAFMPNNPTASAAPIPEPATLLLVSCGLVGFAGLRKKLRNI